MKTEYHDFIVHIEWNNASMIDGYYAIPASFTNLNEHGEVIFEYEMNELDAEGDPTFTGDEDEIVPDGFVYLEDDEDDAYRIHALYKHLDEWDGASVESGNRISIDKREYLVLTDDEADEAWDEELDNYLDECVLGEMNDTAKNYFDRDRWKSDAKMDGRGHSLGRYDGNEYDETNNGGTWYIYRQN